jgi:dTDP-4-amino-4,6-dideoxygalactose transaminase
MDEIQAAFLEIKLSELDRWTQHREALSKIYNDFFDSVGIPRPYTSSTVRHAFHIYSILIKDRDNLRNYLSNNSIETGIHYPTAIVNMEPWKKYFSQTSSTPVSSRIAKQFLSLPLSDQHSSEDLNHITEVIKEFLSHNSL